MSLQVGNTGVVSDMSSVSVLCETKRRNHMPKGTLPDCQELIQETLPPSMCTLEEGGLPTAVVHIHSAPNLQEP